MECLVVGQANLPVVKTLVHNNAVSELCIARTENLLQIFHRAFRETPTYLATEGYEFGRSREHGADSIPNSLAAEPTHIAPSDNSPIA